MSIVGSADGLFFENVPCRVAGKSDFVLCSKRWSHSYSPPLAFHTYSALLCFSEEGAIPMCAQKIIFY